MTRYLIVCFLLKTFPLFRLQPLRPSGNFSFALISNLIACLDIYCLYISLLIFSFFPLHTINSCPWNSALTSLLRSGLAPAPPPKSPPASRAENLKMWKSVAHIKTFHLIKINDNTTANWPPPYIKYSPPYRR